MKKYGLFLLLILTSQNCFASASDRSVEEIFNRVYNASTNSLKTSGGGTISGDVGQLDNAVLRADLTSGDIQSSGVTIDDSNNLSVPGTITAGPANDPGVVLDTNTSGDLDGWFGINENAGGTTAGDKLGFGIGSTINTTPVYEYAIDTLNNKFQRLGSNTESLVIGSNSTNVVSFSSDTGVSSYQFHNNTGAGFISIGHNGTDATIGTTSTANVLFNMPSGTTQYVGIVKTHSGTNTTHEALRLTRNSTGTAAPGIGVYENFVTEDDGGTDFSGGRIEMVMRDVSASSKDGELGFYVIGPNASGTTPTNRMTISSDGAVNINTGGLNLKTTLTADTSASIGWSVVDQTDNQACTTGCTYGCVYGFENATGTSVTNIVNCDATTADLCLCAGPS